MGTQKRTNGKTGRPDDIFLLCGLEGFSDVVSGEFVAADFQGAPVDPKNLKTKGQLRPVRLIFHVNVVTSLITTLDDIAEEMAKSG